MLLRGKSRKEGLNIIIVGGGKVGATLVERLSRENHDITLIDKNRKRLEDIPSTYDVMGVEGNGASFAVQKEAGIDDADLLISVTDSDELNLLCCTLARRAGRCEAIARVRTPEYSQEASFLRGRLGLAMIINPELETANEVARVLCMPTALDICTFAHGQAEMIKIKVPSGNQMCDHTLAEISKAASSKVLICAIERNGEVFIPSGHFVIHAEDKISFIASRKNAKHFLSSVGLQTHQVKSTMIVGGGRVAYYLAKQLINMGINVKIIENDKDRAMKLSEELPAAVVINGDGTDEGLLREEGIEYVESFVPLTGIDEENVMLTLYARKVSEAKCITKITRMGFGSVIESLDLGSVIYPRFITSEAIIAYVRAKKESMGSNNIQTLYHLFDQKAEAIEFNVDKESAVTDIPLMELKLKSNLLIALINRNGRIIIPSGTDCVMVGDTVVIVTTHTGFDAITDILK